MADVNTSRIERHRMMLEDPIIKVIPMVALPMIISMLIDSIYNMADTYFVSHLGRAATAAVGVNDSMLHFIRSVAMGFGMGAASYMSRLLGARRDEEACCVGTTAMFTSIIILSAIAGVCYLFLSPLVTLLGATETVKPYSMDYARFILISAPITAGEVALSQMLRSEGSTKFAMFGMVSGCVVNVALDPLFIHTLGMQVAGAALATTISKALSLVVLLIPFLQKKTVMEIRFRYFTPKWSIYKEVIRMGLPTFLRASMMTVSSVLTNNIAGSFSDSALAAVSVANKSTRLVGSAIMGFGQGFQPVAGYCWGAKAYRRVRHAFWVTSGLGAILAAVIGAAMAIGAKALVRVFAADDPDIISIGTLMIRTQCYTMIFHVWGMIINGLFQALGRALPAAVLGLARQVICLIPCVIVLPKLFGVTGLACAQAVADLMSMCIAVPMVAGISRELKRLIAEGVDPVQALPAEEPKIDVIQD